MQRYDPVNSGMSRQSMGHYVRFSDAQSALSEKDKRIAATGPVLDAVKNLLQVKGRFHTEQAYKRLEAAYGDWLRLPKEADSATGEGT